MRRKERKTRAIFYNWKTLVGFEVLYKLVTAVLFIPFVQAIFNGAMRLSGYHYLTLENLFSFVTNWATLLAAALLALLFSLICMIDIGSVAFILDCSRRKKRITIYQVWVFLYRKVLRRIFQGKNILFLLTTLFLMPFLCIGIIPSYVSTVSVPSFIWTNIRKYDKIVAVILAGWILLTAFLFRWIYAVHYFVLEQADFKEACKKSRELISGKKIRDAVCLFVVQLVFYLCYFVFAFMGVVLVLFFGKIFSSLRLINIMEASAIWGLIFVIFSILFGLEIPIAYGTVSWMFYRHKKEKQEPIYESEIPPGIRNRRYRKRLFAAQLLLVVAAFFGYVFLVYRSSAEKIDIQVESLRTMEVTAHRGASMYMPENTMPAFEVALEKGADWIELDVQQSKDGQIFVMHDRNFKRTTGVDKFSWELDYDEIRQLDASRLAGADQEETRIPLLKEVIEFAKENGICLNIELKPVSFEVDFEKKVVDLINEMEFRDQCVVTSQKYQTLEKIKEYDETITTVYVMSFAYGNINRLEYADNFSVESSSITPWMVSRIHNEGKQIYAWTVNSKKSINKMIDLNVDNIITDNITLAQKCIYESKTSDMVQKFIRFIRAH